MTTEIQADISFPTLRRGWGGNLQGHFSNKFSSLPPRSFALKFPNFRLKFWFTHPCMGIGVNGVAFRCAETSSDVVHDVAVFSDTYFQFCVRRQSFRRPSLRLEPVVLATCRLPMAR